MSEPLPTFASNKDRLTYLLAEYRVPLSVMILAAGVWVSWARPELPTPPQTLVDFSVASFIIALPAYVFGIQVAKYLHAKGGVTVGIADPGTNGEDGGPGLYDAKRVPTELWESKTVVGAPPMQPDEGFDYVVTRLNWYEEIGELEVRGVDQAAMEPGEAWENAKRVDEVFLHHQSIRRAYSNLKATVHSYATDIHDATIMMMMSESEKAKLAPEVSVTTLIEEMEEDVEDLPSGPKNDHDPQHARVHGLDEFDGDLPDGATELDDQQPMMNDGGSVE
jgi:hypothetical protein